MNSVGKEITIFDLPDPAFIVDSEVCLGDEIGFIDLSYGNGSSIVDWQWNLGDGASISGKNQNIFIHTQVYLMLIYQYILKRVVSLIL